MDGEVTYSSEQYGQIRMFDADVNPDMDPRLQLATLKINQGIQKPASASTEANHIAVLAKITDLQKWEELSEITVGAIIKSPDENDFLVTARIPVSRVEFIRKQPFVKSLKAAQRVQSQLTETVRETNSTPTLLPSGNQTNGGRGVVIGIVDFGCDFVHENFRKSDGSTRFLAIWDQNASPLPNSPFQYGRLYERNEINAALQMPDPYAALGYAPEFAPKGTHGTHVTDIAAGNGNGSGVAGIAPEADLIFVELSASDIPWSGDEVIGSSFGDSVQLIEAVDFIFRSAGDRPCVVNLSLGTNGGPHDGTTLVEQAIDSFAEQRDNRAVVIAASNSFGDGIHTTGTVTNLNSETIEWNIPLTNFTHKEVELWYDGADRIGVELIDPGGNSLFLVDPGDPPRVLSIGGQIAAVVSNRLSDPNNSDNMIGVFLESTLPTGKWGLRLTGLNITDGKFHAWIERDDSSPSSFLPPNDSSYTIGSISCGNKSIVVGSYDAHKTTLPLSWFSSAGPTRDGREKPEISAPGHDVWAAKSRTGNSVVKKSGTSMAAPAVAGIIALIFAEAVGQGKSLTIDELRQILISTARQTPPSSVWDDRYGFGRISAADAVSKV